MGSHAQATVITPNSRARPGSNQPPEGIPESDVEELTQRLLRDHKALLDRYRDLTLGNERLPTKIDGPETVQKVTVHIACVHQWCIDAKAAHGKEKATFLRLGRAVDAVFLHRSKVLADGIAAAQRLLTRYQEALREEQRRRQRAEQAAAAKLRAEAEAKAVEERRKATELAGSNRAAAKEHLRLAEDAERLADQQLAVIEAEPAKGHIHTDYGQTVYLRGKPEFDIVDPAAVPLEIMTGDYDRLKEYLRPVVAPLWQADHAAGRPLREIPGLEARWVESSTVKR